MEKGKTQVVKTPCRLSLSIGAITGRAAILFVRTLMTSMIGKICLSSIQNRAPSIVRKWFFVSWHPYEEAPRSFLEANDVFGAAVYLRILLSLASFDLALEGWTGLNGGFGWIDTVQQKSQERTEDFEVMMMMMMMMMMMLLLLLLLSS